MAAITVAAISLLGWPDGSDTSHGGFEGLEFGLDALDEPRLYLDVAPLTLNLDLLLLDETPLFFKLRTNLGLINHFASLKRPSMRAIRDKALTTAVPKGTLLQRTKLSRFAHSSRSLDTVL